MSKKYFNLVLLSMFVIIIYNSSFPQPARAANNYDFSVNSYQEYYNVIAQSVLSSKSKVSIKLSNYNPNSYDFNRVMQQLTHDYPEIIYHYQGAQLQIRGHYPYQKFRIEDIYFQYKSPAIKEVKNIDNYSQFANAIAKAFQSFDSSLVLKINNYQPAVYNLGKTIENILASNPDLDYGYIGATTQVSNTGNRRIMQISFQYAFAKNQMEYMRNAVNQKSKRIIAAVIKPGMTDYQKELALHNYLINNARYSHNNLLNGNGPKEEYTPYGVLIKGIGGCSSYAKAFQKLCNLAGVKCIYVSGMAKGVPHAWDIVKIKGRYYHVDVTWDDPVTSSGRQLLRYDYFNLPDSKMMKDHQWNRSKYPPCG